MVELAKRILKHLAGLGYNGRPEPLGPFLDTLRAEAVDVLLALDSLREHGLIQYDDLAPPNAEQSTGWTVSARITKRGIDYYNGIEAMRDDMAKAEAHRKSLRGVAWSILLAGGMIGGGQVGAAAIDHYTQPVKAGIEMVVKPTVQHDDADPSGKTFVVKFKFETPKDSLIGAK